jgi:hypothetical protein
MVGICVVERPTLHSTFILLLMGQCSPDMKADYEGHISFSPHKIYQSLPKQSIIKCSSSIAAATAHQQRQWQWQRRASSSASSSALCVFLCLFLFLRGLRGCVSVSLSFFAGFEGFVCVSVSLSFFETGR